MWQNGPITTIKMQLKGDQSNVAVTVHAVEGAEHIAVIDSGLVWGYDQLERGLVEAGIDKRRISLLLNTHEHMDHIGNNARLVRETGCLVAAQGRHAAWIEDHNLGADRMVLRFPDVEPVFDPGPEYLDWMETEETSVNIHLAEGAVVNLGGDVELEVLELPGHSLSEIGFYERSTGALVFGDALMPTHVPVLYLYEDPRAARSTCRRITQLARERDLSVVLSGHGEPCDQEELIVWAADCYERTEQIERAVLSAVEANPGITLGPLRDVVTEGLGKLREWRALITISGHLTDLHDRGVIAREGDGWRLTNEIART